MRSTEELRILMTHQPSLIQGNRKQYEEKPIEAPVRDTGQVGGDHYAKMQEGYEPFDIALVHKMNCLEFTILKYLLRYKDKNGKEDLLKLIDTAEDLIAYVYD